MSIRPIKRVSQSVLTREGAGVRLRRAFPFGEPDEFDPFLLLDDFRSDNPDDYRAGFPWHPHRGIETITYVLAGAVEHQDSLSNKGVLGAGDIQWMTAGSGILHQEMPQGDPLGRMHGFQLWANLPSSLKMTKPRYQDVPARDVPEVVEDDGTAVRVLCGRFGGKTGPVEGIAANPRYLDVSVPAGHFKRLAVDVEQRAFAYVFAGSGTFRDASEPRGAQTELVGAASSRPPGTDDASNRTLVLFDRGDEVVVRAGEQGVRFLLVSGEPIQEPIAWYGPIVMNTEAELLQAQRELQSGTFIKAR
jgi:quercetin 2,3-dioxygenase